MQFLRERLRVRMHPVAVAWGDKLNKRDKGGHFPTGRRTALHRTSHSVARDGVFEVDGCHRTAPNLCDDCLESMWKGEDGGGMPSRLSEYAGWYSQVAALVHVLRRESSTRGWGGGGLSTHGVGVKGGGFQKLRELGSP